MRAMSYTRFGAASDVLDAIDLPTPSPADGEVLVELHYSGVNPSDVKARSGARPGVTAPPFPRIVPHSDGAGVITAVGDGVDDARIGQRVWIWNGQWQRPFGTAATHICLPGEQAVALPEGVSEQTGATLGIPGLTAAQAVFGNGPITGQSLLIQGGAGTVGLLAVQLARWGGAHVVATARGTGIEAAENAGAHDVIDFSAPNPAEALLAANNDAFYDRIVEVEYGLNAATDAEVIAPNGTIAAFGSALDMTPRIPFGPMLFKAVTLDILLIYILPKPAREAAIAYLHDALSQGALTCPIADILALSDCHVAHDAVARGGRDGAILLDVRT